MRRSRNVTCWQSEAGNQDFDAIRSNSQNSRLGVRKAILADLLLAYLLPKSKLFTSSNENLQANQEKRIS